MPTLDGSVPVADGPALRGGGPRPPSVSGAGHLLERERELQGLLAALADARRGAGSLVVVDGLAGLGKTRLLDVTRRAAHDRGMLVLTARGAELEQELPFGVATQLLQPHLEGTEPAERAMLLSGHAARAATLFDGALAAGHAETPGDPLPEMLHALHWLCARIAAEHSYGTYRLVVTSTRVGSRSSTVTRVRASP